MLAFDWPERDSLLAITSSAVILGTVICAFTYFIVKIRSDNELKRSMVERGMSVEEIERVLAAKSKL